MGGSHSRCPRNGVGAAPMAVTGQLPPHLLAQPRLEGPDHGCACLLSSPWPGAFSSSLPLQMHRAGRLRNGPDP